jgi:predicted SnoaL-like aldol condensation-catalyzing enzyme
MSRTKLEKNKALVLEAFDTLFNKRYYVAAERHWSPGYIQHSAHITPGRGVCSISSRAFRRRLSMSRERSSLMETS